jgi:hypothetical protein
MIFISLGEFERRHGVNKGSVSRKAKELGFSTSSGLDAEAYAAMLEAFDIDITTEASPAPSVVEVQAEDSSSALAYYGGVSGGETSIISLGGVESRLAGREHHRQAIGQSFQNVFDTRRQRLQMLAEAAILDADTDAEAYAALYQARLDQNLARHATAAGLVMGKDAGAAGTGGS